MEKEILDFPEQGTTSFYKKSVQQFVLSMRCLFGILLLSVLEFLMLNFNGMITTIMVIIYVILIIACWVNAVKGFMNGIKSFKHKENYGTKRVAVLFGNFILFVSPIAALLIANVMDFYRAF